MARPRQWADQPAWTADDDARLLGLYVKGKPLIDYAIELGWSEEIIRRRLINHGLPRLPRGRMAGSTNSDGCDRSRD